MLNLIGIGARLKEARFAKELSLEDLQNSTKIQQRYLLAIENEEFDVIPGAFYVRVFIKQYAEAVDLDAEEILSLYKEEYESAVQEKQEKTIPTTMQRSAGTSQNSQLKEALPKIIVALFIIMIFIIIYTLLRDKAADPGINNDSSEPDSAIVAEPDEEATPAEEEKPKSPVEHASTSGETSIYKLSDPDKLTVLVKTTGSSWISITDQDGQELMPKGARVMQEGEEIELEANDAESLKIRVGNYKHAKLTINGQRLDYPTDLVPQNIVVKKP